MPINTKWRKSKPTAVRRVGGKAGRAGRVPDSVSNPSSASSALSDLGRHMFIYVQCLLTCQRNGHRLPCSCKIVMVMQGTQGVRSLWAGTWHTRARVESYWMLPTFKNVHSEVFWQKSQNCLNCLNRIMPISTSLSGNLIL